MQIHKLGQFIYSYELLIKLTIQLERGLAPKIEGRIVHQEIVQYRIYTFLVMKKCHCILNKSQLITL